MRFKRGIISIAQSPILPVHEVRSAAWRKVLWEIRTHVDESCQDPLSLLDFLVIIAGETLAICESKGHTGRISGEDLLERVRRQELEDDLLALGILNDVVALCDTRTQNRSSKSLVAAGVAIIGIQGWKHTFVDILVVQWHLRAGAINVTLLLQEVVCGGEVVDHHEFVTGIVEHVEGSVLLAPLFVNQPWRVFGGLMEVSKEGKSTRSWWQRELRGLGLAGRERRNSHIYEMTQSVKDNAGNGRTEELAEGL
jgi:hypothetical protein